MEAAVWLAGSTAKAEHGTPIKDHAFGKRPSSERLSRGTASVPGTYREFKGNGGRRSSFESRGDEIDMWRGRPSRDSLPFGRRSPRFNYLDGAFSAFSIEQTSLSNGGALMKVISKGSPDSESCLRSGNALHKVGF
jgi:hypothetical protein